MKTIPLDVALRVARKRVAAAGAAGDSQAMPALEVGTLAEPIPAEFTARIRLHYLKGMNKDDAPALACRQNTGGQCTLAYAGESTEIALQEKSFCQFGLDPHRIAPGATNSLKYLYLNVGTLEGAVARQAEHGDLEAIAIQHFGDRAHRVR